MFRKIPLPTVAVALALSATGGLLKLQGFALLYWLFGAAAAVFLLSFLIKALRYPRDIWTDISGSSILASVSGAFFMPGCQPPLAAVFLQDRLCRKKQRPDDSARLGAHTAQTIQTAAPQQMLQDCLRLIIPVMGYGDDSPRSQPLPLAMEKRIPQVPGRRFQRLSMSTTNQSSRRPFFLYAFFSIAVPHYLSSALPPIIQCTLLRGKPPKASFFTPLEVICRSNAAVYRTAVFAAEMVPDIIHGKPPAAADPPAPRRAGPDPPDQWPPAPHRPLR